MIYLDFYNFGIHDLYGFCKIWICMILDLHDFGFYNFGFYNFGFYNFGFYNFGFA
jgi:hypothetical protein